MNETKFKLLAYFLICSIVIRVSLSAKIKDNYTGYTPSPNWISSSNNTGTVFYFIIDYICILL